tara:strand:- start:10679 stop:10999 length:321 start_codon:yes stop_codon:yes gene_type:complete
MSKKRIAAQKRNWAKLRLMGFFLNRKFLTEEEQRKYDLAMDLLQDINLNWDENTEKFLGHKLPPCKCYCCGRRSNVLYTIPWISPNSKITVCRKHYLELKEEEHGT